MADTQIRSAAAMRDERLRRAIPTLGVRHPSPPDHADTAPSVWRLALGAWPYIYRYIGGRWIGLGAGGASHEAGSFLFMPVLVTALAALCLSAAPPAAGPADPAAFWEMVGDSLGGVLAVLAWLTWLARGRWQAGFALAGALVGVMAAVLVWLSAPTLGDKALGAALLVAYLSGAVLRFRLRGGAAMWVRVESHLVYYYLASTACYAVIGLILAFLTDLLYQSILSGTPLTQSVAALLGHPEMAHGTTRTLGKLYLSAGQRDRLRYDYVGLYFAGAQYGGLISIPTLYIGLPYYWTFIHQRINQNLRLDLMERWQRLSPRYHTGHRVGDSIYRLYQDSAQISNLITRLQIAFGSAIGWVSACAIALFFDWRLALFVGGMGIPMLAWARWYTPRLRARALAAREANSDLTSRAQELLTGVRIVKAYGQEEREQRRFEADSVIAFDAAFRARWLFVLTGVVAFGIAAVFLLPVQYLTAVWSGEGRATFAAGLIALVGLSFFRWSVAAFTWTTTRFTTATIQIRDLSTEWAATQDNVSGLRRVFDILGTEPDVTDAPGARPFERFARDIRFENVRFGYDPERPILRDVSFTATAGCVTAIVGPTGSGKSTLMALLLRLFDPDGGRVLIDGEDLRAFTVASLRDRIAIAPQEPVLFAASIAENLRYAAPQADEHALAEAVSVACADEFLAELPDGAATVLGERGAGLSPGQKQRLCIARALAKQAPILILDEPTAPLDAETEHRLMGNLSRWAQGRAVFIVTHRLSTVRRADHILFIDGGEVVEAGSHAALMAIPRGRYRAMVAAESALADAPQAAE